MCRSFFLVTCRRSNYLCRQGRCGMIGLDFSHSLAYGRILPCFLKIVVCLKANEQIGGNAQG